MYRFILECTGLPNALGAQAAIDIAEEFTHRPWHQNVRCEWDGVNLLLYAENDWDEEAKAIRDEFSDAISACIEVGFDGALNVISITPESPNPDTG